MNSSSQKIILAIAPGKRELGIAVFNNTELVYSSVKTIGQGKSADSLYPQVVSAIQSLFEGFAPNIVVVKAVSQYQKLSPDLEKIAGRIRLEAARINLETREITLEEIKSELCKTEEMGATEKKAFRKIITVYPELRKYWNRPNKWQNDYYAFLFSAVAAGAVYLKMLSERK